MSRFHVVDLNKPSRDEPRHRFLPPQRPCQHMDLNMFTEQVLIAHFSRIDHPHSHIAILTKLAACRCHRGPCVHILRTSVDVPVTGITPTDWFRPFCFASYSASSTRCNICS